MELTAKTESESHSVVSESLNHKDYTVHGILQVRILEWVALPFSRGSSQPRDRTQVSCIQAVSLLSELPRKPKVLDYTCILKLYLLFQCYWKKYAQPES